MLNLSWLQKDPVKLNAAAFHIIVLLGFDNRFTNSLKKCITINITKSNKLVKLAYLEMLFFLLLNANSDDDTLLYVCAY